MRIVLQRVSEAEVKVADSIVGKINRGYILLVGVEEEDSHEDIEWLSQKLINMRLFNDENGKINLSINEVQGSILSISQFTLHASIKKGNRPSFVRSANAVFAEKMYLEFNAKLESKLGKKIECGVFGADMKVQLINDGPVTIIMDSKNKE